METCTSTQQKPMLSTHMAGEKGLCLTGKKNPKTSSHQATITEVFSPGTSAGTVCAHGTAPGQHDKEPPAQQGPLHHQYTTSTAAP